MNLGTRIALLVGAAVLLATTIAGTGLAVSSRTVGRDVIDRDLDVAARGVAGPDGRPAAALVRAALNRRLERCDQPTQAPAGTRDHGRDRGSNDNDRDRKPPPRPARFQSPQLRSGLQLIQPDGTTTASCLSTFTPVDEEAMIAETGTGRFRRSVEIDGELYRVLTVGYGNLGAVQFAEEMQVVEDTTSGLVARIISFGLIGAVLAGAFGWLWARQATRPVRELSATAERVAATQDLGERIEVSGNDEISNLAKSFNSMLVSLETSRAQQHQLVQDASHELRTPLTSIRTNIDLLQRHPTMDDDTRATILNDIRAEVEELSGLSAELVESATEIDNSPSARIETDLESLVEGCVTRARRSHSRDIELSVSNPAVVMVDPVAISRAVDNLIGNAAKFTPADREIVALVDASTVTVNDRGPGIPAEDLPSIFDRFYRATTARSEPGSGLGLSIVQQIVQAHDGEVFASNRPGGGASVGFTLPAAT